MSGFRHELKFLCSETQLKNLYTHLAPVMSKDKHTGENGHYLIRSIYFDDPSDSCFYENEGSVSPREKWRIRTYDMQTGHISLECKRKERGLIKKSSCPLTPMQYEQLIAPFPKNQLFQNQNESPLLRRFLILQKNRQFMPKIIVQYERIPFVYPPGNVRITFDRHIVSSRSIRQFFAANLPVRPILETGQALLEVKYDELLPDSLRQLTQLREMQQLSFSKYYLCRQYSL